MTARQVRAIVSIGVEDVDGRIEGARCLLSYETADPAAVQIFFIAPGGPQRQIVGRALLARGLDSVTLLGEGAVTIWRQGDGVRIRLRMVEILLKRSDLTAFLAQTEGLCATGSPAECEAIWSSLAVGFSSMDGAS